jgi:hypothetical protein
LNAVIDVAGNFFGAERIFFGAKRWLGWHEFILYGTDAHET